MERTDVSDLRRSDWSFGPGDELRDARNWRSESGGGYDFVWGFLIVRAGKGVLAYPEAGDCVAPRMDDSRVCHWIGGGGDTADYRVFLCHEPVDGTNAA